MTVRLKYTACFIIILRIEFQYGNWRCKRLDLLKWAKRICKLCPHMNGVIEGVSTLITARLAHFSNYSFSFFSHQVQPTNPRGHKVRDPNTEA